MRGGVNSKKNKCLFHKRRKGRKLPASRAPHLTGWPRGGGAGPGRGLPARGAPPDGLRNGGSGAGAGGWGLGAGALPQGAPGPADGYLGDPLSPDVRVPAVAFVPEGFLRTRILIMESLRD